MPLEGLKRRKIYNKMISLGKRMLNVYSLYKTIINVSCYLLDCIMNQELHSNPFHSVTKKATNLHSFLNHCETLSISVWLSESVLHISVLLEKQLSQIISMSCWHRLYLHIKQLIQLNYQVANTVLHQVTESHRRWREFVITCTAQ